MFDDELLEAIIMRHPSRGVSNAKLDAIGRLIAARLSARVVGDDHATVAEN